MIAPRLLLILLGLFLNLTSSAQPQNSRVPPPNQANAKRVLSATGKLRLLTRTEAEVDGTSGTGQPVKLVFVMNSSTKCDKVHVGDTVQIVYTTGVPKGTALNISKTGSPTPEPVQQPDGGGAGGVAHNRAPNTVRVVPEVASNARPSLPASRVSAPPASGLRRSDACSTCSRAPVPPLTNDGVIALVDHGFRDEAIVQVLQNAGRVHFDLTPDAKKRLTKSGVSEGVQEAMQVVTEVQDSQRWTGMAMSYGWAHPTPLTNAKIIRMTQIGFSDAYIRNAVRHAGAIDFDLGPSGRHELTDGGVSEPVLSAMETQQASEAQQNKPRGERNGGPAFSLPQAPNPASPPAAELPFTIPMGESVDQVIAALGEPRSIVDLGAKKIYIYADPKNHYSDLKITFVDGKVTDLQ